MRTLPIISLVEYAEQELAMYRNALPAMIEMKKTTKGAADYRLACGEAIVSSLRLLLPPAGVEGTKPVVCHFATEAERDAFVREYRTGRKKK